MQMYDINARTHSHVHNFYILKIREKILMHVAKFHSFTLLSTENYNRKCDDIALKKANNNNKKKANPNHCGIVNFCTVVCRTQCIVHC